MYDYFCSAADKLNKKIADKENSLLKGDYDINPTAARFPFSPMQPQEKIKAMNKFKTSGRNANLSSAPKSTFQLISVFRPVSWQLEDSKGWTSL